MKEHPAKTILFLAPNVLGFFLFTVGPVFVAIGLSMFAWDMFSQPTFLGGDNFYELLAMDLPTHRLAIFSTGGLGAIAVILGVFVLQRGLWRRLLLGSGLCGLLAAAILVGQFGIPLSPRFWQSIGNTIILMIGLPLGMLGSLVLAVLLNEKVFANQFFRLVYFLPSIVGGVGIYLLWKWIFNPYYGPINAALSAFFGIDGPGWFESAEWAKPAMIIMNFWTQVGGGNMILYLAALQSIDFGLYEAAKIDGAGPVRRFFHVTVPMVSTTTAFILIMGVISGFQGGFDAAYVITGGGPAGATTTINYFIYECAFQNFEMGRACAASVILFGIVLAVSWFNWKFVAEKAYY